MVYLISPLAHMTPCDILVSPTLQVLLEARSKLEVVVDQRMDDAVSRRDQAAVLRYAKLYKPLGKQVSAGGVLETFQGHLQAHRHGLWGYSPVALIPEGSHTKHSNHHL